MAFMVTEKTVMNRTDEYPRLLAMVCIAAAQENAVNFRNMSKILRSIKKRCPR